MAQHRSYAYELYRRWKDLWGGAVRQKGAVKVDRMALKAVNKYIFNINCEDNGLCYYNYW